MLRFPRLSNALSCSDASKRPAHWLEEPALPTARGTMQTSPLEISAQGNIASHRHLVHPPSSMKLLHDDPDETPSHLTYSHLTSPHSSPPTLPPSLQTANPQIPSICARKIPIPVPPPCHFPTPNHSASPPYQTSADRPDTDIACPCSGS
ncbi:hypothetical protein L207DRAFT_223971 [Hyaloscypha variabilis F]|uniref:Uncharacterized protein n=1 Tax=Hyaloscypha variabilis (strain UAMH 11265 / GT02V1 / F) TaxID=1149755 RepID=A0A2J6QWH2_HYAVF|nr:hypothetical protein L207DRAFT_223971 [Hyaloscypha variabilis F]